MESGGGALNIALGLLLLFQWPWSGLWFLGLAIGLSLLINGVAIGIAAWEAHSGAASVLSRA
ncbi:hypothetical protein CAL65_06220 [Alkalilimnicola ehrlichii]|uniref:Uncharacterized protein n=1 Tax=Alkalilimnicola ehrlichii TaxID=351052 RepID=A0A3E0X1V0_9GAMM|nr:hypothetical protein CAL65_06220 [Alkalilimnicola ehrlichii]